MLMLYIIYGVGAARVAREFDMSVEAVYSRYAYFLKTLEFDKIKK